MTKLRPLLILGTRPEAIKMSPIVSECKRRTEEIDAIVCTTGQHREMLAQVTDYFGIQVDIHLDLMTPRQTLAELTSRCIKGINNVLEHTKPDCVVVQGDTTTVMSASLAAFYRNVSVVHVEAGLRTGNLWAPWPEELNRRVTDMLTTLHCAPTQKAAEILLAEDILPEAVRVTGNTVIDALLETLHRERANADVWKKKYAVLGDYPTVLITGHRRESFGQGFKNICQAIADLADIFKNHRFIYPVHLNPNVQNPVYSLLGDRRNVHLVPPVPYPEFVWLMDRSKLIMTDSGGVQEEAPSLRKPVIVMRDITERPEAIDAGAARLVGTSVDTIVDNVSSLLSNAAEYASCQIDHNPYGDGHAAKRIVNWMIEQDWI